MPNPPLHQLIATTYTKDNLHKKILYLRSFFSNYFFKDNQGEAIKLALAKHLDGEQATPYLKDTLVNLGDDFYSFFNQENFNSVLDSLDNEVKQYPIITMYVPVLLPPSEVEKLGTWLRTNVSEQIFMELSVDQSAIGGCKFVWNGMVHDFSLSKRLEGHATEIKQLLKNYDTNG